jgi:hypothetical protein
MFCQWQYSGGTLNFEQDERKVDWSPDVETIDTTAGADTVRSFINSFTNATASISFVEQTNSAGTASALGPGTRGTLIIASEGTATGKRKIIFPSMSKGAKYSYPFDGISEVTCEFVSTGTYQDTTW